MASVVFCSLTGWICRGFIILDWRCLMKILVIGGTGFLGSRIVTRLVGRGHEVRVLTRNARRPMPFDASSVGVIEGDISRRESLTGIESGIEVIVYAAMPPFKPGRISSKRFTELESLVRLYFTNTIDFARRTGAFLILTSGASFATKEGEVADESWPVARVGMASIGRAYDELVAGIKRTGDIRHLEMLPAQIYGSGGMFARMIENAKAGRVIVLGSGRNYMPRVHVDDCAEAFVLAVERQPAGERFIVCDDVPCTVLEFMSCLGRLCDARKRIRIPSPLLRIVVGKHVYQTLTMNSVVTNKKIRETLGWLPQYPDCGSGLKAVLSE